MAVERLERQVREQAEKREVALERDKQCGEAEHSIRVRGEIER